MWWGDFWWIYCDIFGGVFVYVDFCFDGVLEWIFVGDSLLFNRGLFVLVGIWWGVCCYLCRCCVRIVG